MISLPGSGFSRALDAVDEVDAGRRPRRRGTATASAAVRVRRRRTGDGAEGGRVDRGVGRQGARTRRRRVADADLDDALLDSSQPPQSRLFPVINANHPRYRDSSVCLKFKYYLTKYGALFFSQLFLGLQQ